MVIDKGLGMMETAGLLDLAATYIDYWKLPFGTSAFYPTGLLREKINVCKTHGVHVYPGGTFLEVALLQGRLEAYLDRAQELGFDAIEVSDGTVPIGMLARRQAISRAAAMGFAVLSEVGKKDPTDRVSWSYVHRTIDEDLSHGARCVIVEGRESGAGVGIYNADGDIQEDELAKIVAGISDLAVLMWEAPQKAQQEELIVRFGVNVNLGNIPPQEILALEALRRGLRADTLRTTLRATAQELPKGQ